METNKGSKIGTGGAEEVAELMGRLALIAPIAKRDPNANKRGMANASLRAIYTRLAYLQKSGVSVPTIDMGAL